MADADFIIVGFELGACVGAYTDMVDLAIEESMPASLTSDQADLNSHQEWLLS